jgi:hypothetical protein
MRHALDTVMGLVRLAQLALVSRLRLRGPYWTWRWHTAFGRGVPPSRRELIRAVMAYGRWMHRMRRGD